MVMTLNKKDLLVALAVIMGTLLLLTITNIAACIVTCTRSTKLNGKIKDFRKELDKLSLGETVPVKHLHGNFNGDVCDSESHVKVQEQEEVYATINKAGKSSDKACCTEEYGTVDLEDVIHDEGAVSQEHALLEDQEDNNEHAMVVADGSILPYRSGLCLSGRNSYYIK
ncbi:hypothetical protein [Candidatus Neoehrlichia procyonis]|uniref:Uncharacterized protein n=1 Tax=Candidatus Neoehrlichia procyonis str. RAC413 TaxID=1359163 RepID=A0A0F3NM96_9RICK|nr:hypothetical protein [Candidatus Neoehrlichia lotoris]KJV69178.1 hypothetical protein NLO413_0555 [Candidatus Neoehrlichia lotoris str. RAC413]